MRNKINCIFIICLFLNTSLLHARNIPGTIERHLRNETNQQYLVYLPKNYDPKKKYPLLIAVHWLNGTDREILENWYQFSNRDQYILLCPQFESGHGTLSNGDDKILLHMMKEVEQEFNYDRKNVMLFGCSAGAQFAHRFVFKHPQSIKTVAMFAAGSYSPPPSNTKVKKVKFLVGIGEMDFSRMIITNQFYQSLLIQGYDAQFKILPGIAHSCGIDVQVAASEYFKRL